MKPLVDAKTAQEVAAEAKQIVQDAIKDAERATGVTHEQFRQSMEDQRKLHAWRVRHDPSPRAIQFLVES